MRRLKNVGLLTLLATMLSTGLVNSLQGFAQEEVENRPSSVEERRLQVNIQDERARLWSEYQQKEQYLTQKEIELKVLQEEVDKKLEEMMTLEKKLRVLVGKKEVVEQKRLKQLSQMYEKMEPARAANLLADLDEELAIDIISGMKAKSAGKVFNAMDRGRAVALSEAFPEIRVN